MSWQNQQAQSKSTVSQRRLTDAAAPCSPSSCISPVHDVQGCAELYGRLQTEQVDFDVEPDLLISLWRCPKDRV